MNSPALALDALSDDVLLARLADLVGRSRRVEAELVRHLAEVDARRLYLREACPSMHAYATERLHLSDAEAYLRITVARVSRRLPVVLAMLADGRLHLSGIARLAPHLRAENSDGVLGRAAFRSKREIEMLVAEIAPSPDLPSCMRRLPAPTSTGPSRPTGSAGLVPGGASRETVGQPALAAAPPAAVPAREKPPVLAPIAPARYKVQFTAGAELRDKITRAQAFLRRQIPDGDLAAIVDRAMTLLLRELEREKFGATSAPRKSAGQADATASSRRIPDPIRRAVWQRDSGQCTFRDRERRRCSARERLEFHHVVPFARGGDHSEGNVALMCSMHNHYQAELDYGAAVMAAHRGVRAAPAVAGPGGHRGRGTRGTPREDPPVRRSRPEGGVDSDRSALGPVERAQAMRSP